MNAFLKSLGLVSNENMVVRDRDVLFELSSSLKNVDSRSQELVLLASQQTAEPLKAIKPSDHPAKKTPVR